MLDHLQDKHGTHFENDIVNLEINTPNSDNSPLNCDTRKKICQNLLNIEFETTIQSVREDLLKSEAVCVTTDLWSSIQRYPYLGVTVNYFNENLFLVSKNLATKHLPGSHTSVNIRDGLIDVFNEWEISEKIIGLVTDNASNTINLAELINEYYLDISTGSTSNNILQFSCAAHVLNLIVKKALNFGKDLIEDDINNFDENDSLQVIASAFHQSQVLNDCLNLKQAFLNIKQHEITQDVCTRWNSTYLMLERINEQVEAINEVVSEKNFRKKFESLTISVIELVMLKEAIGILDYFYQATVELSANKYVTISIVLPTFYCLKEALMPETKDSDFILTLKKVLYHYIDFYTTKYNIFEKDNKKAINFIKKLNLGLSQPLTNKINNKDEYDVNENSLEPKAKLQIFDTDKDYNSKTVKAKVAKLTGIDRELFCYNLESTYINDPIEFWKLNKKNFPLLFRIFKRLFCIPVTPVPSEELFSKSGYTIWDRRCKIKPVKVNKMMVIYGNL
ncbi:unnamed protein product [Brachionus calyciflorus]|uniref:HAT C-terminal dimerisation domain-containing protein n=1 Tax=Brachionus calyciflorus TaxID=104777 RepID=A0A813M667_9BILA|nr:unnamed protein product [Brachionus calyciflorus]